MKGYLSILLSTITLSGCAMFAGIEDSVTDSIIIEKVDSRLASVGNVTVTQIESALRVRGEVIRKIAGRGPIYGHIHIEVLGADDRLLLDIGGDYRRRNTKVRSAGFSEMLNIDAAAAKKVVVTHHARRHNY
ncbi:hypothetical protein [Sulfuriflexus sp.]|uniref:hypothetical protein n=1 Tax=Sulfuriflexus sp. TaxID=2015443 RepID=UPI0028CC06DC|nr:hypothetical protein [Sulfuriflexus sp.]MDT8403188.1 hypothetical protein [Sulfuriflexus sp.]